MHYTHMNLQTDSGLCYINNALLPDVRAKSILLFFTNLIFITTVYSRTSFIIDSVVVCAQVWGYSQFETLFQCKNSGTIHLPQRSSSRRVCI